MLSRAFQYSFCSMLRSDLPKAWRVLMRFFRIKFLPDGRNRATLSYRLRRKTWKKFYKFWLH